MVDQASASTTINAEPAQIMAVIADLSAYPEWSTGVKSVTVDETDSDGRPSVATFTLDAGVLQDTYTLRYDWQGDERVEWHLVKGKALKRQDGSYTLRPTGDATEVTYQLTVDLNIPMLGMFKRKAEKVIMDVALKGLKARVEGR